MCSEQTEIMNENCVAGDSGSEGFVKVSDQIHVRDGSISRVLDGWRIRKSAR